MRNAVIATVIILLIITSGLVIAYDNGYIPLRQDFEIKKPIGNAYELTTDISPDMSILPDETLDGPFEEAKIISAEMSKIPEIEDLKYSIFVTNEEPNNVYQSYKEDLIEEGYGEEDEYSGHVYYKGYDIDYHTFVKGLTGVVFGTIEKGDNSVVVYTTGNVLDYKNALNELSGIN